MPVTYTTEEHLYMYKIKIISVDSRPAIFNVSPFKARVGRNPIGSFSELSTGNRLIKEGHYTISVV